MFGRFLARCAVLAIAAPAVAQEYTYVKMSLGVPWALYFMFLVLVTIPFGVMIWLAWRHRARDKTTEEEARKQADAAARVA